jgi:hypothetical protein
VKYNTNAGAVYASGEVTVFDGDTYTFDAPIIQNLEVISYVWVNPVPNDELCSVIF